MIAGISSADHEGVEEDADRDRGADLDQLLQRQQGQGGEGAGKLKSETFKRAGTFTYFCEIHPEMHGTVEVVEKD